MDAIVMAGGIPQPDDPLYPYTQGQPKALLDVAGKPMIQWVLDALSGSRLVERVVIIGLDADSGLNCEKPLSFLPNQGSMVDNILAGIREVQRQNPQADQVLTVSSDIPAITAEMVDWVAEQALAHDLDILYNVIERQVMEARYPNSRRSYTRLKDVEVCGGDLNAVAARMASSKQDIWERITAARKNVFKQAALIGYDTLLLLLLRQLTLNRAIEIVCRRLHIQGKAVLCPYAEIGMDVDKPFQLDILRQDLAQRAA